MSRRFLSTLVASALTLGLVCTASASSNYVDATDTNFMRHAAADGVAEIEMGQLALEKSSDPQVRQLAQRLVTDHTNADGKLRAIAVRKHVLLPSTPSSEAMGEADAMKQMAGQDFDRAWSAAIVNDHVKAVDMFTTESQQAKDADVRRFAQNTTPVLKTHLQIAQTLAGGSPMNSAENGH